MTRTLCSSMRFMTAKRYLCKAPVRSNQPFCPYLFQELFAK